MKRSLLAVCGLAVLSAVAGCATEADDADGSFLGEARQDLALAPAPAEAASPAAEETDSETPARPQPEPWGVKTQGSKPVPAGGEDPRRRTTNVDAAEGDEGRPQPEPWAEPGSSASLTTNKQ